MSHYFSLFLFISIVLTPFCEAQETFTDERDGQSYETVIIGEQTWMAENINFEKGNCWCYDNKPENCEKYGRLYTWKTAKKVCPSGWQLPSDAEWQQLTDYLADNGYNYDSTLGGGGNKIAKSMASVEGWKGKDMNITSDIEYLASALKNIEIIIWAEDGLIGKDTLQNNRSGFNALPGGCYIIGNNSFFDDLLEETKWWSSDIIKENKERAWGRNLENDKAYLFRSKYMDITEAHSVRCIKE